MVADGLTAVAEGRSRDTVAVGVDCEVGGCDAFGLAVLGWRTIPGSPPGHCAGTEVNTKVPTAATSVTPIAIPVIKP